MNFKLVAVALVTLFPLNFTCLSWANSGGGFEEWKSSQGQRFREYRDSRDKEFLDFLNKDWYEFKVSKGLARDKAPKPVKSPIATNTPIDILPESPDDPSITLKFLTPNVSAIKKPVVPKKTERPSQKEGVPVTVNFFGTPVLINYTDGMKIDFDARVDKEKIIKMWDVLSRSNYEDLLGQVMFYKKELQLNDWGYGVLVNQVAQEIYKDNDSVKNIFVWFILVKSGYDARVGYSETGAFLLLPAQTRIYNTPNFILEGKKYYVISFDGQVEDVGGLFTYKANYPKADNVFNLNMVTPPLLQGVIKNKNLTFVYSGTKHTISGEYNTNIIDYLNSFPQTDLEVYFNSSVSENTAYSLLNGLKPLVEGKSETEAVNIILRFVQTAFAYQTDGDQFGTEKYFFREETLFYPYSDCEDRAILFAFLVKKMTGLDVVGLDFPGHVANAVHFTGDVVGDYIMYEGKKYIISDPTFVNANIGRRMPRFEKVTPKVIDVLL